MFVIDINVVSNHDSELSVGKRRFNRKEKCYTKKIKAIIPGNEWDKLYALMQHIKSECSDGCKHCKEAKRKGWQ